MASVHPVVDPDQLQHIVTAGYDVLATRFLTLAALVILIFECLRKLTEDMVFIWPSSFSIPKALYITNRIIVLVGALAGNYALAGFQDHIPLTTSVFLLLALRNTDCCRCRFILTTNSILATVSIGIADGLVTYEVWNLWDRNRTAMWMMTSSFVVTYSVAIGCMVSAIVTHNQYIHFEPLFKICALDPPPKIVAGVYASGLVFEVIMFFSAFLNVLAKPRDSRTSLTKLLMRDGSYYFVAVSVLRLVNVLVVLLGRPSLFYCTGFLVWAIITVLLNRLVQNQYRGRLTFDYRYTMELANLGLVDKTDEEVVHNMLSPTTRQRPLVF